MSIYSHLLVLVYMDPHTGAVILSPLFVFSFFGWPEHAWLVVSQAQAERSTLLGLWYPGLEPKARACSVRVHEFCEAELISLAPPVGRRARSRNNNHFINIRYKQQEWLHALPRGLVVWKTGVSMVVELLDPGGECGCGEG